jgi:hypothetical protein
VQASDDLRVGTELAGYRIESLLGWGGMSVVGTTSFAWSSSTARTARGFGPPSATSAPSTAVRADPGSETPSACLPAANAKELEPE